MHMCFQYIVLLKIIKKVLCNYVYIETYIEISITTKVSFPLCQTQCLDNWQAFYNLKSKKKVELEQFLN